MFTTRPEILGTFGVVATTHWLASATGMAILEKGGNAFDAAVATGFALQVVEPHLNGPGGEVPMIVHDRKRGEMEVICGQGVSPAAATMAHYRGLGFDLMPGTGLLAATVPGAFDAWMLLLRDYGTMTLADVLTPAIAFAENGYPVVPNITKTVDTVRDLFANEWKTSAAVYLKDGKAPQPGTLFRNPGMAAMYKRILSEAEAVGGDRDRQIEAARAAWSKGFVAEAIDTFCRTTEAIDDSGRRNKGILTADDMANWQASVEKPTTLEYGRYTVAVIPPWSQGPVLVQQLALLKGYDLDKTDPLGPDFLHLFIESGKLAMADREQFYADSAQVEVPMETLLSAAYNDERRKLIGDAASKEPRPGEVPGLERWMDKEAGTRLGRAPEYANFSIGEPTVRRDGNTAGDTCHMDIIDRWGNMVSATPSGGWLQSSPIIPELGFCLTNRMQMFWLNEKSASALAPNRRPRTTLTANMALRDGKPYMAFGTPGGDQ
ncbi:gamma-glutamyltransferase family protein, partial [Falsiroseomonas sp.]|uniref:gamma-glutamyltransferase family protein n=1 Tax=Falsiroseomonas sp. TaxID=2870721 RepID=UPI00271823B9